VKRQILGLICGAAVAFLAPVATQAAPPAHASHAPASGGSEQDLRCLLFAMNMSSSQNEGARTVGIVGMAYYLGRMDASGSHGDLTARAEAQVAQMKGQDIGAIAKVCGETLSGRMKAAGQLNKTLQEKFAPQAAAPAAQAPLVLKPIPAPSH